jgi:hypothetical protein
LRICIELGGKQVCGQWFSKRHLYRFVAGAVILMVLAFGLRVVFFPSRSPEPVEPSTIDYTGIGEKDDEFVPIFRFSMEYADKKAPKDVSEALYYPLPYMITVFSWSTDCSGPSVPPTTGVALPGRITVPSCGWQPGETVHVALKLSTGETITNEITAGHPSGIEIEGEHGYLDTPIAIFSSHEFDLDAPEGEYTYVFEGREGAVEGVVYAEKSTGPHLFFDVDGRTYRYKRGKDLHLYGFAPNENVRCFLYRENRYADGALFVGWKRFQVGSKGELIIQLESEYIPIVIGDVSGEVTVDDS